MKQKKKLIFIGRNRFLENGPIFPFFETSKNKNFDCTLITDKENLKYPCANGNLFEDELKRKNLKFITVESPNEPRSVELMQSADFIFSVNCHWILKKELLQFVKKKIFNFHNSSLPEQQGAGCHSWRIMQGIKTFHLTMHYLSEQIDEGDTIYEQKLEVPNSCRNLKETYSFISNHETKAFEECLDKIIKTYPNINAISKKGRKAYYWPRLNTDLHGYIDWTWTAQEIKQFCDAFDDPFDGASTFLSNERVRFKNVEIDDENVKFHPFQYGIIYRINDDKIWVAAKNGGLLVNQVIYPNSIKLRKGKRFITDNQTLLNAKKNI